MILLSEEHIGEIKRHGERTYPQECCGLLIGRFTGDGGKEVFKTFPVENASEAGARHNRSLITPEELMRGEKYARQRGLEVIGNYHSHPDHPARPSDFDLEHALPVWSYIIVAVSPAGAGEISSWVLKNDRSRFDREEIGITRTAPPDRGGNFYQGEIIL